MSYIPDLTERYPEGFTCGSAREWASLDVIIDEYDDDYSQNMPCDNSGVCSGSSCSNYPRCQGWVK